MKYLVLLIGDGEQPAWETLTEEQQAAVMQQHDDFCTACGEREGVEILGGEALGPAETATVMRSRGGKVTLTEGPYAEALEGFGGYYLVEAPDLDVLVELLKLLPPDDIQVSPVIEYT